MRPEAVFSIIAEREFNLFNTGEFAVSLVERVNPLLNLTEVLFTTEWYGILCEPLSA